MSAISSNNTFSHRTNPGRAYFCIYGTVCLLCCVILSLLAGCAPQKPVQRPHQDTLWTLFLQKQTALPKIRGFAIRASINYTSARQRHRVIMRLYGDLDYPIRMDLEAGIGRTISVWREDASSWQAYLPEENRLYLARDGKTGARSLGFPSPFDLKELAQVLQGNIASVLPPDPVAGTPKNGEHYLFFPARSRISKVLLDTQARVIEIYGKKGWTVSFDYQESSPYSKKIIMTMEDDTRATLRIKSITSSTFATDLAISLEDNTEIIRLDERIPKASTRGKKAGTYSGAHTLK